MERDAVASNPSINYGDNKSACKWNKAVLFVVFIYAMCTDHQAIATKVAQTQGGVESMREKLQAERRRESNVESTLVHGMQGLSQSQHLNDLSMNANF
jgi:hypothetical protein